MCGNAIAQRNKIYQTWPIQIILVSRIILLMVFILSWGCKTNIHHWTYPLATGQASLITASCMVVVHCCTVQGEIYIDSFHSSDCKGVRGDLRH